MSFRMRFNSYLSNITKACLSLSLLSTSSMCNISIRYFEAPRGYVYSSPRDTPSVNKSHIPSWPQNNLYLIKWWDVLGVEGESQLES